MHCCLQVGLSCVQIAELGHGTFGMVVKALDIRTKPPTEVAIKMLPRGDFVSTLLLVICSIFAMQVALQIEIGQ